MRQAVRAAMVAAAAGRAVMPGVLHLDLGEDRGDVHVKGGWLTGQPVFAIKVAGAFRGAVAAGLATQQGLSMVFDATTGAPLALLLDDGWLTEIRTGAAGAAAVEHLAPKSVGTLAILGAGSQARHQAHATLRVRTPDRVLVWARHLEAAAILATELQQRYGMNAQPCSSAGRATAEADVVITTTPARTPILRAADLAADVVVIAVGADTPGKHELDTAILATAARIVVDDLTQCATQGELQHLPASRPRTTAAPMLLGDLFAGSPAAVPGRTVVDLTGLGVQDTAAAQVTLDALGIALLE